MKSQDDSKETKDGSLSRRAFLGGAVAAGALLTQACKSFSIVPRHVIGGPHFTPPSEKLQIALIGVGGMGAWAVGATEGETHVAYCDVDDARAADTYEKYPNVKRYKDFRVMLEKEDANIDAVAISTPDHIHAPAAMMAIKMGKHVFCQKPLTHSIYEARELAKATREHGVMTQMGIQGHANEGSRLLCEWVWAGSIGPVREVWVWTNRPIWPQGIERPTDRPAIPKTLDWDLWLGPAAERPYNEAYAPFGWRGWWDFGCGALGDHGCHAFDGAYWALNLKHPSLVSAVNSPVNDESAPKWSVVTYEFPERPSPAPGGGTLPPLKLSYFDGAVMPPRPPELEEDRRMSNEVGAELIIGDEGKILTSGAYYKSVRLIPETRMKEFLPNRPPKTIKRSPGHMVEFIDACKGGPEPPANFEYSAGLTEMVHLGNLAIRSGQPIEWDPEAMRVTNVPEANRFVRREYRKGWEL